METGATAIAHRLYSRFALRLERALLPRYSVVLAASGADADRIHSIAPGARALVYPNAIPQTPAPPRAEQNAVVFSGNMEYLPNVSAARFFRNEVWPKLRDGWPSLVWQVLGKNPNGVSKYTSGDARIHVIGPVTDAIAELARAKVAVVPLLAGSGTRLKILEAWAAATPVVSTRIGAEGLPVRDGEHLLLADSAAEFASSVSRLLADPALRESLGAAGRRLVEREFFWEAAWKSLNF